MGRGSLTQMKVLYVTGSYPPMRCGVGDYARRLILALGADRQYEVSVLTSQLEADALSPSHEKVMRIMPTWHARYREVFSSAMRSLRPDIVHIQFPTQGYDNWSGLFAMAFLARIRWRVPVVATMHEFLPKTVFRADRWIYGLAVIANRLIVVRPEYHAAMPPAMRVFVPRRKIQYISNASVIPAITLSDQERVAIRERIGCGTAKLIAFFGFSYFHKGVDLLFKIADPREHHLLLIGELKAHDAYHSQLRSLAESEEWKGRVTITGFVDPDTAAKMLATADAALFPYRVGGGVWNSSLHAATSQGTFALTTSLERNGYDAAGHVYYARPENVDEMRQALLKYQGRRKESASLDPWIEIARAHKAMYSSLTARKAVR